MSNPINKAAAGATLIQMIADEPHSVAMYKGRPGIGLAKKKRRYTGDKYHFEVEYGPGDNSSYDARQALLKRNQWRKARFEVDTVESFNAKDVTARAMREATTPNAFVDVLENIKKTLDQVAGEEAERGLYRSKGNAKARLASFTSGTLQLESSAQARQFNVDDYIRLASTDGTSGSLRAGIAQIIGKSDDLAQLYVTGNLVDTIALAGQTDYIFADGSFNNGRSGLPDWVPVAVPDTTLFHNVDRSPSERLYGHRSLSNVGDIAQALRDANTKIKASGDGEDTNVATMSVEMLSKFTEQQEQKVVYNTLKGESVTVGFKSISFQAAGIELELVASWAHPDDIAWIFPSSALELLHSTDGLYELVDDDGNVLARNPDDFSFDIRTLSIYNYVLRNMNGSAVVTFAV